MADLYVVDTHVLIWYFIGSKRLKSALKEKIDDRLLANYPELKKEDIQAALLYARASLDLTEVKAVGA